MTKRVVFKRTRFDKKGNEEQVSEHVNFSNESTEEEIYEALILWSETRGRGDYTWKYAEQN